MLTDLSSQQSLQFAIIQSHEITSTSKALVMAIIMAVMRITSKALIMALAKTSASSLLLKFRPYTCLLSRHYNYINNEFLVLYIEINNLTYSHTCKFFFIHGKHKQIIFRTHVFWVQCIYTWWKVGVAWLYFRPFSMAQLITTWALDYYYQTIQVDNWPPRDHDQIIIKQYNLRIFHYEIMIQLWSNHNQIMIWLSSNNDQIMIQLWSNHNQIIIQS